MQDELKALGEAVQATWGVPVTINHGSGESVSCYGIVRSTLEPVNGFDQVMQCVTTVRLARHIVLRRGDQVIRDGQTWRVDRKLKDDGQFVTWNLHEQ
ncbi:hypothetical protein [Endozoicomonas sp. Mp262]|uniref:head-tail joining protein n=1 Tax=Endozoicomonas sp. Mp262 TaxID=2919499 RepID=UPI0021DB4DA8